MEMGSINWLAILVAGISSFVVGGIWYSPGLFGKAWMKDNNLTEDDVKRGNKGKIFGWTLIFSLLMAANLGMFLAEPKASCPTECVPKVDLAWGGYRRFSGRYLDLQCNCYSQFIRAKTLARYSYQWIL